MKRLRAWGNDLMGFLFPLETDRWLTVLRIGLGLQLAVYTLFLKNDWHYLFAGTAKGLVSRELGEAITSLDSPFIPKLGWLALCGMFFVARTFLPPGRHHCLVSSPLRC